MDAAIRFVKMWSDEDMVELQIDISDGASTFAHQVYVGHQRLKETVAGLDRFKHHVHGGLYDLRFGEFGPEYASGAFHARLHFQNGGLYISIAAQSGHLDFGNKQVASDCHLYVRSEPAQLDNFIRALKAVSNGDSDNATLAASPPW